MLYVVITPSDGKASKYGIHTVEVLLQFICNAYGIGGHTQNILFCPQNLPGIFENHKLHICCKFFVLYPQDSHQPLAKKTCWCRLSVVEEARRDGDQAELWYSHWDNILWFHLQIVQLLYDMLSRRWLSDAFLLQKFTGTVSHI